MAGEVAEGAVAFRPGRQQHEQARPGQQRVGDGHGHAGDRADARLAAEPAEGHGAVEGEAVGQRQVGYAVGGSARDQDFQAGCGLEEAEVGVDVEVGEGHRRS